MKTHTDIQAHWDNVFKTKDTTKVSWYEKHPVLSIDLIRSYADRQNSIIDIGGGNSLLPDALIDAGYKDITVLDISTHALDHTKSRLGEEHLKVKWINSNVLTLHVDHIYDLWFDRAVFHFITHPIDQMRYKNVLQKHLSKNGVAIIGSFSTNDGPEKCSDLEVCRHDTRSMNEIFNPEYEIVDSFEKPHITPSGKSQNFCWTILRKK